MKPLWFRTGEIPDGGGVYRDLIAIRIASGIACDDQERLLERAATVFFGQPVFPVKPVMVTRLLPEGDPLGETRTIPTPGTGGVNDMIEWAAAAGIPRKRLDRKGVPAYLLNREEWHRALDCGAILLRDADVRLAEKAWKRWNYATEAASADEMTVAEIVRKLAEG